MEGFISILRQVTPKEWLILAFGVTLPICISLLSRIRIFVKDFAEISPLLGTWHTYHWTRENFEPIFRYEKWHIKRSFFSSIEVITKDPDRKTLQYRGKAEAIFDGQNVILNFVGRKHSERWFVRMNKPIPGKVNMRGMFIGPDFDQQSFSSIMLASKERIDNEEKAKEIIQRLAQWEPSEASLRIGSNVKVRVT